MTTQVYNLDGPKEFPFPYPVRAAAQLTVEIVPGNIVSPGDYEVVGVGPTSTQVTVRYPNAPTTGGLQLKISRYVAPERVTVIDDPSDITTVNLNAEFNNIYEALIDFEEFILNLVQQMLDDFEANVLDPALAEITQARDDAVAAKDAAEDAQQGAEQAEQGATAAWDAFRDRYWGAFPSDPSVSPIGNPPTAGDLYWNTTVGQWRVWDAGAGAWVSATSSVPAHYDRRNYVATEGQTTFEATYDAGFVQVWVNGLLLPPDDYEASTGTEVVLDEGVVAGTEVSIVGLGAVVIGALDGNNAMVTTLTGTQLLPEALDDRVAYVPGISALRALTGMQEGQSVQMTGTSRAGFYLWDPSNLSAEVSVDTNESNYIAPGGQDGSQGAWVRIGDRARYFSGKAILPFLDRPERSGVYRIAGVPDTPRATGFVVARIESTGGALYGHAQFFSYGSPPVESIASLENGVWTPWRSIALTSDVSLEAMEDEGLLDIRGGVPVVRDRVITLGKGSYSWWCEPIASVFGEVYQRIGVSCVSSNGWQRTLFADSFDSTRTIRQADYGAEYPADEHNSPAVLEIEGRIFTFYTGHNDDGNMRMRRSSSLDPITIGPEEIIHTSPSNISYAQVGYMGGKIYVFYRGPNSTRNMLISDDLGDTWTNYPVLEYPGWQVYMRATFPFADGTIRLVVTLNPTQTAPNRLWIANINTNTLRVRAGGADIADLTLGQIAQVPDMTEVFDPAGDRVRLFDVQDHGTSAALQRWLVCVWDVSSTATGEYRYMECDLSTGVLTKNVKICDSGAAFGSLYHAGMCFSHVTPGTPGNVNVGPVFSIRRTPGNDGSILEQYNSPDGGDTWNLADTIRETSDSEAKMWRPRVPVDTRNRYRARQIDLVWNEGVYNSFEDFDSVIKGRLRFVDPA